MRSLTVLPLVGILLAPAAGPAHGQELPGWVERLSFKGDLRLRYDAIDEEGEIDRDRARYRARFAVTAAVNERVSLIMELASGAENPVSRNATFDGGFTTKDFGMDLAYVDWAIADDWRFYGGKMKNPLFRPGGSAVVYDSDLNPEGVALAFSRGAFFATAGVFSVEERSSADDTWLTAVQFGGKFDLADDTKLTAGVGYFGYSNTVGNEPFYNGASAGNSVDAEGNYLYEYRNTEAFVTLDTRLGDTPLTLYAHWVNNGEVDVEDTAYGLGARVGIGKTSVGWRYTDLEADAVIGTFTDSDFGGGGVDMDGHTLWATHPVGRGVTLAATLFLNEVDRFQGTAHDYTRLILDVSFGFN
ncbi:MAG: putative porin [Woeseiaceae bacterium]|nr:putative porin [Woeseiaceae bacterium]